jgi:hypothetical protein
VDCRSGVICCCREKGEKTGLESHLFTSMSSYQYLICFFGLLVWQHDTSSSRWKPNISSLLPLCESLYQVCHHMEAFGNIKRPNGEWCFDFSFYPNTVCNAFLIPQTEVMSLCWEFFPPHFQNKPRFLVCVCVCVCECVCMCVCFVVVLHRVSLCFAGWSRFKWLIASCINGTTGMHHYAQEGFKHSYCFQKLTAIIQYVKFQKILRDLFFF